jgi:hypothetical protein
MCQTPGGQAGGRLGSRLGIRSSADRQRHQSIRGQRVRDASHDELQCVLNGRALRATVRCEWPGARRVASHRRGGERRASAQQGQPARLNAREVSQPPASSPTNGSSLPFTHPLYAL